MSLLDQITENFHRWEKRGRGGLTYPVPVELEPPFVPFPGHILKFENSLQDGTKPTLLSRLTDTVFRALQPPSDDASLKVADPAAPTDPDPLWFGEEAEPPLEGRVLLPADASPSPESMAHFLTTLSLASGPLAFEVIGDQSHVSVQIVTRWPDADLLAGQLQAQFPEAKTEWTQEGLFEAWGDGVDCERLVVDFGLFREFMLPLQVSKGLDSLVSLVGGMGGLGSGEGAVYQVLFSPLQAPWREEGLRAVRKEDGKPFFRDGAELLRGATEKLSRPLYGVVPRLAVKAGSLPRAWDVLRGLATTLRLFSREGGQSLMPLSNLDYDHDAHADDVLWRRSRRCGMIMSLDELVGLAHWPTAAVKSAKLARHVEERTRAAPRVDEEFLSRGTVILGMNRHDGWDSEVVLTPARRLQHMHVVGGTGTGKSTLLLGMMLQDLRAGQGFAVLDPHGDLIDDLLTRVPFERINDIVLLDPSDEEHIVPFNVLSAHSDAEKTLLASDLVSVFRRFSTSWGDRMNVIFQNLVLAFLEHEEGGTLVDMRRFLVDKKWRDAFLNGVGDPDVQFYWGNTFPRLDGVKSIGPILTRLETLLTPKVIRYMVSQRENRLDFGEIMNDGRILLVKLPHGQIGHEVASMLGSLVMAKLQQMAMSRARMPARERTPFFCYVDECHHFITPSMGEILTGARKYGLGLLLAHQHLQQLSKSGDVAASVMANTATRVAFRVSESDARALAADYAHYEPADFASLPNYEALCRIERADQDFSFHVVQPLPIDEEEGDLHRGEAMGASRKRYTVSRSAVEAALRRPAPTDKSAAVASPEKQEPEKPKAPSVKPPAEQPPPVPESAPTDMVLPLTGPLAPTKPPPLPGKGGVRHKELQHQIKKEGERLGFRSQIEVPIGAGHESVDVVLTRDGMRIACEISATTSVDVELPNLRKCIREGFSIIALLSENPNHVASMAKIAPAVAGKEKAGSIRCECPGAFIEFLGSLVSAAAPGDKRIRGFKVRRSFVPTSLAERAAQIEKVIKILAREMPHPAREEEAWTGSGHKG